MATKPENSSPKSSPACNHAAGSSAGFQSLIVAHIIFDRTTIAGDNEAAGMYQLRRRGVDVP